MARLGDFCTFYSGTGFPIQYQGNNEGDYPFYKVGDIAKNVINGNKYLKICDNYISNDVVKIIKGTIIPENTIVFAKIGEAVKLNRRVITSCKSLVDNNVMGIKPNEDVVDIRYFYQYMLNLRLESLAEATTVPSVKKSVVENIELQLPKLQKQIYIAEKLEKVDELISCRKEQLAKLDELVKARFVEMFGDPIVNEKGWNTKPLLEMGSCKNGMNFHYEDTGVEINCLGVGDFKDYSIISDTSILPTISLNEVPSDDYMLRNKDIVFVRSNGNKALVGRSVAVYPGKVPTTFSGFCIRYRKTDEAVNIPYLLRVLKTESIREKMAGRGANIQNLNQQILGTLIIPIPPIELQNQFATFVEQTEKTKAEAQKSLDELETLKKSLMQKYFG